MPGVTVGVSYCTKWLWWPFDFFFNNKYLFYCYFLSHLECFRPGQGRVKRVSRSRFIENVGVGRVHHLVSAKLDSELNQT